MVLKAQISKSVMAAIMVIIIIITVSVYIIKTPVFDTEKNETAQPSLNQKPVVEEKNESRIKDKENQTETVKDNQTKTVEENKTTNNTQLPLGPADLAVTGITYSPKLPRINEAITFTATVQNIGGEAAETGMVKIVALTDIVSVVQKAVIDKTSLSPGETAVITATYKIASTGIVTFRAGVDIFNKVKEASENNNQYDLRLRIQPANGFVGCKTTSTSVCSDFVGGDYFITHPNCTAVSNCNEPLVKCSDDCPYPE